MHLNLKFLLQDSVKITEIEKESEESTNLIPQLEGDIPKLQKLLSDEESLLEEIKENAKGNAQLIVIMLGYQIVGGLEKIFTFVRELEFLSFESSNLFSLQSIRQRIQFLIGFSTNFKSISP